MSIWQGILAFAGVLGLVVDGIAIVKEKKKQAIIGLVLLGVLVLGLVWETAHVVRLEERNKALTDAQSRAQKLIDEWDNVSDGFDSEFNSPGTNEGIASAAADLMEDVEECRPHAAEEAKQRLMTARELTMGLSATDSEVYNIWENAADAAYQQVLGVANVPPDC